LKFIIGLMSDFILPDYKGNNIVNLMSSISYNFGKRHYYVEHKFLSSKELRKFKNIVMIVVDGLGYNYLNGKKDSFLFKNIRSKTTSTFLSTTACANTVFSIGYPPQQHALTGWDINLKEVGAVSTILPFIPIYGGEDLSKSGFKMKNILDTPSFHKGFNCKCYTLIDKKLSGSSFTSYISRDSEIVPTKNYKNTFTKLKEVVSQKCDKRRFIHAYIYELDSLSHKKGFDSPNVAFIFQDIDRRITEFSKFLKGTNTGLIVISDHGFINISPKTEIWVEDIDGLKECLTVTLAGEPRTRDCFVRPSKVKQFESIVKNKMDEYCWCFKGEELIQKNFYGLGKPNKKLFDRVGDYVLIMKKNYILRERLANYQKPEKFHKGKHGGVSENEMFVPLIFVPC
jgi:predicted AlkP superfamily pyrophosphatase or phosphodiesterase